MLHHPVQDGMKKEEVEAAMDSLRGQLRAAEEAKRDVRPVVGEVFGMDSASDVYAFALDHLKIDHTDIKDVAALRALFKLASTKSPAVIAQDAAPLFPATKRFRHA